MNHKYMPLYIVAVALSACDPVDLQATTDRAKQGLTRVGETTQDTSTRARRTLETIGAGAEGALGTTVEVLEQVGERAETVAEMLEVSPVRQPASGPVVFERH